MKIIIAIQGVRDAGKTATIKRIYGMLEVVYPQAKIQVRFTGVDISIVVTIGHIKIGIESEGDPSKKGATPKSRLLDSLDYFTEIGCNMIICATRTRGATVKAVKKHSSEYRITWIEKKPSSDPAQRDGSEDAIVQSVLEQVKRMIDA